MILKFSTGLKIPTAWRRVAIKLPVPMYNFIPTIFDDNLLIVGYYGADRAVKRSAYKLSIANVTTLFDEQLT